MCLVLKGIKGPSPQESSIKEKKKNVPNVCNIWVKFMQSCVPHVMPSMPSLSFHHFHCDQSCATIMTWSCPCCSTHQLALAWPPTPICHTVWYRRPRYLFSHQTAAPQSYQTRQFCPPFFVLLKAQLSHNVKRNLANSHYVYRCITVNMKC